MAHVPDFAETLAHALVHVANRLIRTAFGPDGPVLRSQPFTAVLLANLSGFERTWQRLADQPSRQLFLDMVLYRFLDGNFASIGTAITRERRDACVAAIQAWPRRESEFAGRVDDFDGWRLCHYPDITFAGARLKLDTWGEHFLRDMLYFGQYFFERDGVRIQPEPGDAVLDVGACLGDTAVLFAAATAGGPNGDGHVYSFEPLPVHLALSEHNRQQNGLDARIHLIPYAAAAEASGPDPAEGAAAGEPAHPGFRVQGKTHQLPMRPVDTVVAEQGLARVDFIKMDIEGFELEALKGAADTIRRFGPKLAIAIYHRHKDLYEIPDFLAELRPDYEFYLEHYSCSRLESVLYARLPSGAGGS